MDGRVSAPNNRRPAGCILALPGFLHRPALKSEGFGMEWVAMAPVTGILVMFVWPALQFGAKNELLFLALLLTLIGALINVVFFAEIAREFAESLPP